MANIKISQGIRLGLTMENNHEMLNQCIQDLYSQKNQNFDMNSFDIKNQFRDEKGRFLKNPNRKDLDYQIQKYCRCGCGQKIIIKKYYMWYGIPNYIHGHNTRGKKHKEIENQLIFCGCGCKNNLLKYDNRGRYRKYLRGHSSKGKTNALGHKHTEEWKKIMSEKFNGENNPFYMKKHKKKSIERRNRQRMMNGWFKNPEEHKRRITENAQTNPNFGMRGKKLSEEQSTKHSAIRQGISIEQWKGFITPIHQKIRNSPRIQEWRKYIFKRDNWICKKCLKKGGKLHAHHIRKFSKYPLLRFDFNNGITLCKICHDKTKGKEEKFIEYFDKKVQEINKSEEMKDLFNV